MASLRLSHALRGHAGRWLQGDGIHQPTDQVLRRVRQKAGEEMLLGVVLQARPHLAARSPNIFDRMTGTAAISLDERMALIRLAASDGKTRGLLWGLAAGGKSGEGNQHQDFEARARDHRVDFRRFAEATGNPRDRSAPGGVRSRSAMISPAAR